MHGLTRVSLEDLTRLLRIVHRATVPFPISRASLVLCAFGHLEGELDLLVGRDQAGARALLVAVIAERTAVAERAKRAAQHAEEARAIERAERDSEG